MRILIIADVHGNLAALEAVLAAMTPFDHIWCLGDLVGYGPDPNACVDVLRNHAHDAVLGNHDAVAIGRRSARDFNPFARFAAEWTAQQLRPATRQFLEGLPLTREVAPFLLVHGSPREPLDEYILSPPTAQACFARCTLPHCLVGHTHVPVVFLGTGDPASPHVEVRPLTPGSQWTLDGPRMILNVGSVGQPRDGDPRAACVLYDTTKGTLQFHRVPYDIARTQQRMREEGLPDFLIDRLAVGQ